MKLIASRHGFFFILDTLLALIVIFSGLVLIMSSPTQIVMTSQAAYTAQDLLKQLSSTHINESSDATIIRARFNGTISAADNYRSILEEIVYLYNISYNGTANEIINSSAVTLIPANYNAEFLINQTLVFVHKSSEVSRQQALFVLTDKRIILGLTNESKLFGPYIVEFRIWQ